MLLTNYPAEDHDKCFLGQVEFLRNVAVIQLKSFKRGAKKLLRFRSQFRWMSSLDVLKPKKHRLANGLNRSSETDAEDELNVFLWIQNLAENWII